MNLEFLLPFLAWSALINMGLLLLWLAAISLSGDAIYRIHGRLFSLSREDFNRFHYSALASYKLATMFFNVIPYLVLRCLL
ncbi:MAG: DUF6868 family protein [Oceanococcus sp.]